MRSNIVLALVLLCITLLPATALPQARSSTIEPAQVSTLETAVNGWMAATKAPALSIAVVKNNTLIFSKGYGLADAENAVKATPQTVYRLASIGKSMTAVAVMQLVERGKIDLNTSIAHYCSAYPEKHSVSGKPDQQFSITVRELLIHQSGVRHNKPDEILSTRHYSTIDEAIATFKDDPLVSEPETKYSYSTPGYTLLGCAIEKASGLAYMDYMRENIFRPAGMTQTSLDDVYAITANRAHGYRKSISGEIQNAPLHDTSIKVPGGGLLTSVEDLARFAIAVNTGRLVRPETLAEMIAKPKTKDGKEQDYATGFLVAYRNGVLRVFNDGSQAGTRTYLFVIPQTGFAVALMTNLERATCEELVPKVMEAFNVQ